MTEKIKTIYFGNVSLIADYLRRHPLVDLQYIVFEDPSDLDELMRFQKKHGIRVIRTPDRQCFEEVMESLDYELGICANFGLKINNKSIHKARCGILNLHPGILPQNKGRYPATRTVENQDEYSALTLHIMTESFDEGPVIGCQLIKIDYPINAAELSSKLYQLGPKVLETHLPVILNNYFEIQS